MSNLFTSFMRKTDNKSADLPQPTSERTKHPVTNKYLGNINVAMEQYKKKLSEETYDLV